MPDPCLFQETIMRNVAETARQGQAIDGMAADMKTVAEKVSMIAEYMTRMRGIVVGVGLSFGVIGTLVGLIIKSIPAIIQRM